MIANRKQCSRGARATLERQAPDVWEEFLGGDSSQELWIRNFGVPRSTYDELCEAVGPLVAPAPSYFWEPVPTDKCPSSAKKCFHCSFSKYVYLFSCECKKSCWGFFIDLFPIRIFSFSNSTNSMETHLLISFRNQTVILPCQKFEALFLLHTNGCSAN